VRNTQPVVDSRARNKDRVKKGLLRLIKVYEVL